MALTDHAPTRRPEGPGPRECGVAFVARRLGTDAERAQFAEWMADPEVDLGSVARIVHAEVGYQISVDTLRRHRRAVLDTTGSRCKCVEGV